MKKQLLFVAQYLHTGGIERSLLTLLEDIDTEKYEIDLLLFDYSGALFPLIPKKIHLLPPLFETFSVPLLQAAPILIKRRKFRILAGKIGAAALGKLSSGVGTEKRWLIYRHTLKNQEKQYDAAIGYMDFFCNYYVIEKVKARKKIVYNHMDYLYSQSQGWPSPRLDRKTFLKSNAVVTVAETSKQSLLDIFPELNEKIHVIANRVSPVTIRKLADEKNTLFAENEAVLHIVTVARLTEEKGVLLALEACKLLVEQGYPVKWYIVGNGPLREQLQEKMKKLALGKHFILAGEKENPYPYMKGSDIYVQPSLTEAHCVAVEEALALSCSIVVTNIPSFKKQIEDGKNGVIADTSAAGIAQGIIKVLTSFTKKSSSQNCLFEKRNRDELAKFYQLIEKG
ncbi:glycosyltransferase [Bacillaceae bacterium Marseille-Q3522]|nr:glycosyltransferase [Bacillaceae bacterium Marseille-Q3522]